MQELNVEKRRVLECRGNTLVAANPGTGKTTILGHKYVHLLEGGVKPQDMLCLTYTDKARDEMEALRENGGLQKVLHELIRFRIVEQKLVGWPGRMQEKRYALSKSAAKEKVYEKANVLKASLEKIVGS